MKKTKTKPAQYHIIMDRDGRIQTFKKNPNNDPKLEQQIIERLQRQEDIASGRDLD